MRGSGWRPVCVKIDDVHVNHFISIIYPMFNPLKRFAVFTGPCAAARSVLSPAPSAHEFIFSDYRHIMRNFLLCCSIILLFHLSVVWFVLKVEGPATDQSSRNGTIVKARSFLDI